MATELQNAARKAVVEKLQEARSILMNDVHTAEWSPVFDLISAAVDLTLDGDLYLTPEAYVHGGDYRDGSNQTSQNLYALITLAIGLNARAIHSLQVIDEGKKDKG